MNATDEILARIRRIEHKLGIPADLPPECDVTGCHNLADHITTTGWPKPVTIRRCNSHPLVSENDSAQ